MLVDTSTPEEQYYIKYILYLLKQSKYNKAKEVIKISEDAAYSPLFNYLEALIKFRQNNKKKHFYLLTTQFQKARKTANSF